MVRIWRGHADINWPIHSTAYRRLAADASRTGVSEIDVRRYEKRLLKLAEHKGFRFQEGRELSDLELLARLRHHGAATRFVDATRNALAALWFATFEHANTVGLLIGVHCNYLRGHEGHPERRPYDKVFHDNMSTSDPYTWEPPHVTLRVAAQHSQFLYSPIVTDRLGSLALPKEEGGTLMIALSPKLKEDCEPILMQVYDIRRETLFPDLDGFGIANSVSFSKSGSYRW